jgi:hypothetical protein
MNNFVQIILCYRVIKNIDSSSYRLISLLFGSFSFFFDCIMSCFSSLILLTYKVITILRILSYSYQSRKTIVSKLSRISRFKVKKKKIQGRIDNEVTFERKE